MTGITIRQYHPSDLEECRALWVELTQRHGELYNDPTIRGDTPGLYFDKHLARVGPEHIWVAEHDGEIVGLVGLIVDDREAEVEPLVVASAHRDKGIGRALLNRMLKEAKKSSAKVFIIGTEIGMVYRLKKEMPDKEFYSLGTAKICVNMKKIALDTLYDSLDKGNYEVKVDKDIMAKARRALEEMVKYVN